MMRDYAATSLKIDLDDFVGERCLGRVSQVFGKDQRCLKLLR